jgi:hypothetical protein
MPVSGGDAVRSNDDNFVVGFIADPSDLPPEHLRATVDDDERDFLDGIDAYDEEWDDVEVVERAPRRASSGAPQERAGSRSRMTSMAIGAAGLFADEPGGFDFGGSSQRGPAGRPLRLSPVSRARVIELLEEAAGGLSACGH